MINKLYSKPFQIKVRLALLLVCFAVVTGYFFLSKSNDLFSYLGYGGVILSVFIGISFGGLAALGISLFLNFLFGTWMILGGLNVVALAPINWKDTLWWMFSNLIIAMVSGLVHHVFTVLHQEHDYMAKRFDELVTIDEYSGFSNQKRFFFDLKEEFKRSERNNQLFSIFLIKMEYITRFQKLYGEKEYRHLIDQLSKKIRENTRVSDRKYRIYEDTFALLLPDTPVENMDKMITKFEKVLLTHRLLKKADITLTLKFGFSGYKQDWINETEMFSDAEENLNVYIH